MLSAAILSFSLTLLAPLPLGPSACASVRVHRQGRGYGIIAHVQARVVRRRVSVSCALNKQLYVRWPRRGAWGGPPGPCLSRLQPETTRSSQESAVQLGVWCGPNQKKMHTSRKPTEWTRAFSSGSLCVAVPGRSGFDLACAGPRPSHPRGERPSSTWKGTRMDRRATGDGQAAWRTRQTLHRCCPPSPPGGRGI